MTVDGTGHPPKAAGVRIAWEALPAWLRGVVEEHLGARAVHAVTQPDGFSPGVAARVVLEYGRRVFVKAVGSEPNPQTPALHRTEAQVLAAMPVAAPVPRLLAVVDQAGWVALVLEDIDGVPPSVPWRVAELGRVLAALDELSVLLTLPRTASLARSCCCAAKAPRPLLRPVGPGQPDGPGAAGRPHAGQAAAAPGSHHRQGRAAPAKASTRRCGRLGRVRNLGRLVW
jgi:hypothetical protein